MSDNILLIRPPTVMKGTSFIATQFPLNIAGIAAVLLENGYDVNLIDFDVERFDEEELISRLRNLSPFLIGISCYTPTIVKGHYIAALAKRCLPGATIVVGGPHISALPEETMAEFSNFDVGVIGEGEETLPDMAGELLKKMPLDDVSGIIHRSGGILRRTPPRAQVKDLDKLPFPARHLLRRALYKGQAHRGFSRSFLNITEMMTSRGCPNRCTFCASDVVMGRGVRFRSAGSVKDEITECVEKYGFNHFTISDDTFTLREERLYAICEEFARRKVTWNCNARVWPISKSMLAVMAHSGCNGITFGVESGSPRILRLINKNVTLEQIESAFRWSKEAGIKLIEADVIIGSHPSEGEEDIAMTQRLLNKIAPDIVMVSILVPYPGTEIYRLMRGEGLIHDDKRWDSFVLFGREPSWRTRHFGPRALIRLQRKMLWSFYFRPAYILRRLSKMRSIRELSYWFGAGIEFIFGKVKRG